MKTLLLFIFVPTVAWSQDTKTFDEFFQFLQHPESHVQAFSCPDTSHASHCEDLQKAVCAKTRKNDASDLAKSIEKKFVPRDYDSKRESIKSAQEEVLKRSPASMDEIRSYFTTVNGKMIALVNEQPGIDAETKKKMVQQLSKSNMMDSQQYFDKYLAQMKTKYPDEPEEKLQQAVMESFELNCGATGMYESAFVIDENIIVCPGLLMQTMDLGAKNKEEMFNALTVVFAHETAHQIDTQDFPDQYQEMGKCYNEVSGNPDFWKAKSKEVAADYWASRILGERLATTGTTGESAVDAVYQNLGILCGGELQDMYPTVKQRMNLLFGRNPVMSEVLGCKPPSSEKPVCGLKGKQFEKN